MRRLFKLYFFYLKFICSQKQVNILVLSLISIYAGIEMFSIYAQYYESFDFPNVTQPDTDQSESSSRDPLAGQPSTKHLSRRVQPASPTAGQYNTLSLQTNLSEDYLQPAEVVPSISVQLFAYY